MNVNNLLGCDAISAKSWIQKCTAQFFVNEWEYLREKLRYEYDMYQKDIGCRPPIIAQEMLISAEDHRFFRHPGFDVIAICRAIYRNAFWGVMEGASTIDQQVVRVLTGDYERTIRRKIKEILLATLVTSVVPKKDLPAVYLRIGYYGWRMNDYRSACQRLRFTSSNISHIQAANLIARLKYPEPRNISANRSSQIKGRVIHIMHLHAVHTATSVYKGLRLEEINAPI